MFPLSFCTAYNWLTLSTRSDILAIMVLKISLGIFFARIVVKSWQLILIYTTVGINIFSSATALFYCFFRCGPNLNKYVMQQLMDRCTSKGLDLFISYQQAAVTTLTDLVFVVLTLLILWNANMSLRSKVSVGFILCLAALGCICSAIRFRYIEGLAQTSDFFWQAVDIGIWSTIECGATIVAGCLATLRPLCKRMLGKARDAGCIKHISQSFRSLGRSASSSLPHYNTTSIGAKSIPDVGKSRNMGAAEPTFVEFLVPPGAEVMPMDSQSGKDRLIMNVILSRRDPTDIQFPWPVRPKVHRKRETMHARWTLWRGVGSDGRISGRLSSAPSSPTIYTPGRDAM
jgi:hypothetical protein